MIKNNLQKMIGYEKIYQFHEKVNDNNIKYFYYMEANTHLTGNFFPFDENNNLVQTQHLINKN